MSHLFDSLYTISAANQMTSDEMQVHKVNRDTLHVFAKMGQNGKGWPTKFQHNGHEYEFASNEAMPDHPGVASNYSGYARYVNKNWKAIAPINHIELGAFLQVLGTAMRIANKSANHLCAEFGTDASAKREAAAYIADVANCDEERAMFVIDQCKAEFQSKWFSSIAAVKGKEDDAN